MNPECEETKLLAKFRNQVKDLQETDGTLHRFLKARNYNLNNAEAMLRKSIEWRKENDIDNALNWNINQEIHNAFPMEYPGVDSQNRAVIYVPEGCWPTRELMEAGYRAEMLRNFLFCVEKAVYEITKSAEQGIMIVDMAGTSYWTYAHFETLQHVMQIFRIYEANYPERVEKIYIINAPFYFNYFWSFLKPFLTGSTMSKITVFGNDEKKYMAVLLEHIPVSSMPAALRKLTDQKTADSNMLEQLNLACFNKG